MTTKQTYLDFVDELMTTTGDIIGIWPKINVNGSGKHVVPHLKITAIGTFRARINVSNDSMCYKHPTERISHVLSSQSLFWSKLRNTRRDDPIMSPVVVMSSSTKSR